MSTAVREPQQGVFGNLTVPRHSGLFGLSLLQSAGLVPLVLLFIALLASGRFLVAMVLVAFTCLVILLMKIKVRDGRTVFGRVAVRWSQSRKEKAKKAKKTDGGLTTDAEDDDDDARLTSDSSEDEFDDFHSVRSEA